VTGRVRRLRPALHERDELVAELDEGRVAVALDPSELEEPAVELDRGVDVADLQRDMVDAYKAGPAHGSIRWLSPNSCQR
jgi:hypothetical protein